jgi:hypothetical protein
MSSNKKDEELNLQDLTKEYEKQDNIIINKRSRIKNIEDLITNKNKQVLSFIVDDYMLNCMWNIYEYLKTIKIATTTKRSKETTMFEKNAGILNKCLVKSMVVGLKFNYYKNVYETPAFDKKNGDYLFKLIKKLCDYICNKYDLDLDCNTATINKNFRCSLHTDKKNIGNSLTFSLGDFQGGNLEIRNDDNDSTFIGSYDTKFNPIYFDGSKLPHEVGEFEGDRYSVVCYKI